MDHDLKNRGNAAVARRMPDVRTVTGKLESVFRATSIGMTINVARTIVAVNDSMCELLGYEADAIIGQSARMFYATDAEFDRVAHFLYEPLSRVGRASMEASFRRKDGAVLVVLLTAALFDRDDPASGYVVTVQDLTARLQAEDEKRKLEEELQQAMKMEAVGRLAGGVAHDFNNLLTVIAGNVELTKREMAKDSPILEYMNEIAEAARSAASLTRQLLSFSRRQVVEPRVLDLNELVRHFDRMLARLLGEDVTRKLALSAELGSVRVDPGQYEQVLANLAVNARDAMPTGGTLVIETRNIDLDDAYCAMHPQTRAGRYVLLSVSDTGHGMTDEVKQRLFEPFFTTKPVGLGTGLGLATTFGIVKQSGGSIEVYSELGLGATFKIYLPRVDELPEAAVPTLSTSATATGHEAILLVEDHEGVRAFARTLLRKLGYQVLSASNGKAARDLAQGHAGPIDLLITDVIMPGLNGRQLAMQLTEQRPDLRVLFTSGYAEDVVVHHGVLDPNVHFIGKPYSLASLSTKIRSILDQHG